MGEHKLSIIVSIVGLLAIGATVVARFNTLENANDQRVTQLADLKIAVKDLDQRILSVERNGEIRDRLSDLKADVAVLKNKVDELSSRRRGQ